MADVANMTIDDTVVGRPFVTHRIENLIAGNGFAPMAYQKDENRELRRRKGRKALADTDR